MLRSEKIRIVIVDDEPLARERIRDLLETEPDVELVGEFGEATEAAQEIETLEPDRRLPGHPDAAGGRLRRPGEARRRAATRRHLRDRLRALRGARLRGARRDYLLKPFSRERFYESLETAREAVRRRREASFGDRLVSLVEDLRSGEKRFLARLLVKSEAASSS